MRIDLYRIRVTKNEKTIQALTLKNKDMKVQIYNLKNQDKEKGNSIVDLEKEINKIYNHFDEQIEDRNTTIVEQEKIIKEQDEIINELRRQLKSIGSQTPPIPITPRQRIPLIMKSKYRRKKRRKKENPTLSICAKSLEKERGPERSPCPS